MTRCSYVLVLLLALSSVSCQHVKVPDPYWGLEWGDLPEPKDGKIQICIAQVSTPWLMWIAQDASIQALEDMLGPEFFRQNAPDRLAIPRRLPGNGRSMHWLRYDYSKMTAAQKSSTRLQHGDFIYFWSRKIHPVYSSSTGWSPPNKTVETNRRPACPLDTGREFVSASCAPPSLSAAVAHLLR